MIQITAWSEGEWIRPRSLEALADLEYQWCWVDFSHPTPEEVDYLDTYFHFHPLAIEDCLHWLQRPKVDFYGDYSFFVLHALDKVNSTPEEINLFIGDRFIVSYHDNEEMEEIRFAEETLQEEDTPSWKEGHLYVAYLIMDNIVDGYFPAVFQQEDRLRDFDDLDILKGRGDQIQLLFTIRSELFKLRRTVHGMSDMLYRLLRNSQSKRFADNRWYFEDIYDHLLKIGEIIDANREMTSDIRESLIALHGERVNSVMTLLTVITTIFIPITFIAGVYGMNFISMPMTDHPYGFFVVLGVMLIISISMYRWFRKKGWFNF